MKNIFILLSLIISYNPILGQEASFVSSISDTHIGFCIVVSPDNSYVYASGINTIVTFKKQLDGALIPVQVLNQDHKGITGIRHVIAMVISPDGQYLYGVNIVEQTMMIFNRNTATGEITLKESLPDPIFKNHYSRYYRLLISAQGRYLYWLHRDYTPNANDVLAVFERDPGTGSLNKIQEIKYGDAILNNLTMPGPIDISPDNKHLYGANRQGKMIQFNLDETTGKIISMRAYQSSLTLWTRSSVSVAPDGSTVFASSFGEHKLFIYARYPDDGTLRLLNEFEFFSPWFGGFTAVGLSLYWGAGI